MQGVGVVCVRALTSFTTAPASDATTQTAAGEPSGRLRLRGRKRQSKHVVAFDANVAGSTSTKVIHGHIKTAEQRTIIAYSNTVIGILLVCYIKYSEEGPGWAAASVQTSLLPLHSN